MRRIRSISKVYAMTTAAAAVAALLTACGGGSGADDPPLTIRSHGENVVAVYDALVAIDGKYRPFAVTPRSSAIGASREAAARAAAYGVLAGLCPHRADHYQAAYDGYLSKIVDRDAR